jgi:hypothetical protein
MNGDGGGDDVKTIGVCGSSPFSNNGHLKCIEMSYLIRESFAIAEAPWFQGMHSTSSS